MHKIWTAKRATLERRKRERSGEHQSRRADERDEILDRSIGPVVLSSNTEWTRFEVFEPTDPMY